MNGLQIFTWCVVLGTWLLVGYGIWIGRNTRRDRRALDRFMLAFPPPVPPVNICLHLHDGTVIPVDSTLQGPTWEWLVCTEIDPERIESMTVDELAARNAVRVRGLAPRES